MSTYNNSKYIKYAIQSILNQSYKDFEFLIIDDGSTDKTEDVVNSFKDSRINYFKKSHEGLTKSLNIGLNRASYDLIARMDSDDMSLPNRLEKQMEFLYNTTNINYQVVSNWYCVFNNKRILYLVKTPIYNRDIKKNLLLHSVICHASSMFDRRVLFECGGYKTNYLEDYDLWIRLKDKVIYYNIPEVLYFCRQRKDSMTNQNFKKTLNNAYKIQSPLYGNSLESEYLVKDRYEEVKLRGWREFFYGNKIVARNTWVNLKFKLFINPKVVFAIMVSFLPQGLFIFLKKVRVKFRILYIFKYFTERNIFLRKCLNEFNK